MVRKNSNPEIPGLGLSYPGAIILAALILTLIALYLFRQISLANAAIVAVILVILFQGNNAEVFLVAFILAMIIRCFCIEVYKIPTGSMEPTLHGDYNDGDRIIANKFGILFNPIKRYDVFLFKFPLDKSTSFIKRVVGLPDEELILSRGDIYYRPKGADEFFIAKKPMKTQESIWIPIIESVQTKPGHHAKRYNPSVPPDAWNLPEDGSAVIENGKISLTAGAVISYRDIINDEYVNSSSTGSHVVGDIKLSFKIRAEKSGGEIYATIKTNAGSFILRLFPQPLEPANSDSPNLTWHFRAPSSDALPHNNCIEYHNPSTNYKESIPVNMKIEPNKDHLVEILNFDGAIYINIDNKEAGKFDYITSLEENRPEDDFRHSPIEFGAKKYSATLRDVNIWRDIYYYDDSGILRENKPLAIPAGKYFAIGDNVPNSKDSRLWQARTITLKNGLTIKCDAKPSESYKENGNTVSILRNKQNNRGGDIWGVSHIINKSDIVSDKEEPAPFIGTDEIFGRALFVYWPLNRFKLIR